MGLISKLFGTRSEREIKKIQPIVDKILALEEEYKALSQEQLQGKTGEFKKRLANGETLDDLLPEAFAAIREASLSASQPPISANSTSNSEARMPSSSVKSAFS